MAATDPVTQVNVEEYDLTFERDLRKALRRLGALPPSPEAPYITVAIDWRPDGTQPNSRPGRDVVLRRLDDLIAAEKEHTPGHETLAQARERLKAYLAGEIEPSVQGIYAVAGGEGQVFAPMALGIPIESAVSVGPVPVLSSLARCAEDNPDFAVLVADQQNATLIVVSQTFPASELQVEGEEYPRKQKQGGWSQQRYQMRAEERISAFARAVAERTQKALDENGIDLLIVAGDEVIVPELDAAWHSTMKERIVGRIAVEKSASEARIIAEALPVAERAARDREAATARRLVNGVGGPLAVGGIEQTLLALEEGRVMHLVMTDDFHADGWADYSMPIAGVGEPGGEHPAGGDPAAMVPIALEEEFVRLALGQDASIEIVHGTVPIGQMDDGFVPQAGEGPPRTEAAGLLDGMGGVGAILRYAVVDSGPAMPEA
jgi:hypothetical protein